MTGYLRIGLIVMFLHDLSGVPFAVLQLLDLRAWRRAQVSSRFHVCYLEVMVLSPRWWSWA